MKMDKSNKNLSAAGFLWNEVTASYDKFYTEGTNMDGLDDCLRKLCNANK